MLEMFYGQDRSGGRKGMWKGRIIHDHGKDGDLVLASWEPDAVVPLGEGLLCWVDCYRGVILSDVLDEGTKLWYVPYPAEVLKHQRFPCTNARGAVKLVTVSPRRCSHCGCSEHATAFGTWTLKTDDLAWVLETETNMVDSTETSLIEFMAQARFWPDLVEAGGFCIHIPSPIQRRKQATNPSILETNPIISYPTIKERVIWGALHL
jgi:hypothetical protein